MQTHWRVLITGTNKGIGNDLVKIFLRRHPQVEVYATSREEPAAAELRWKDCEGGDRVVCKKLEIASEESIGQFVEEIKLKNVRFDVVVNNAGISRAQDNEPKIPDLEWSKSVMKTNLLGPIALTEQLLPFLTPSCRVVNISSLLGALKFHPQHTQFRYSNPALQKSEIIQGAQNFLSEVSANKMTNWSFNPYGTSKMLLNAWSRFVLQSWLKPGQFAICVTPGFCRTPMTANIMVDRMAHTSESGALKIYETIMKKEVDPQIFYHRGRPSNYQICGEGLPFEDEQ